MSLSNCQNPNLTSTQRLGFTKWLYTTTNTTTTHHRELNVSNISAVTNPILTKLSRWISGINNNDKNNNNNNSNNNNKNNFLGLCDNLTQSSLYSLNWSTIFLQWVELSTTYFLPYTTFLLRGTTTCGEVKLYHGVKSCTWSIIVLFSRAQKVYQLTKKKFTGKAPATCGWGKGDFWTKI